MQDPRGLRVYEAAQKLASDVYPLALALPPQERCGLSAQLRSAAMSVGSNIAEGCGRCTPRDMCCFLDRALGSANEVQFQVSQAARVGLISRRMSWKAINTTRCVQRMLTSLIRTIRRENGLD